MSRVVDQSAAQNQRAPRDALRVSAQEHDEEHALERRQQPRDADRGAVREPDAQRDVQAHVDEQRAGGPPARLAEHLVGVVGRRGYDGL